MPFSQSTASKMSSYENSVYLAKLAEQAERYEGKPLPKRIHYIGISDTI